jgi:hypothetical protein
LHLGSYNQTAAEVTNLTSGAKAHLLISLVDARLEEAAEKVEAGPGAAGYSRLGKKNKNGVSARLKSCPDTKHSKSDFFRACKVVPCYKAFKADFFSGL